MRVRLTASLGLFLLLCLATVQTASASSGVGISPALENLVVLPSQSSVSYKVAVTNATKTAVTVSTSTKNFTTFGLNATLNFLPASQTSVHTLASSISLNSPTFIVPPNGGIAYETVTINQSNKLSAGGHYGAVLFGVSAYRSTNSNTQVSLHQTLASLIFLTTAGQGTVKLSLLSPGRQVAVFDFPTNLNLVFSNHGNVQSTPRGYVSIANPFGKQIAKTILNPNSGLLLPGTERLLQTAISRPGGWLWPGRYQMNIYYRDNSSPNFQLKTMSIFYIGSITMLIGAVCLLIVVILVIKYHVVNTSHESKK